MKDVTDKKEVVDKKVVKNEIYPLEVATGALPSGKKIRVTAAGAKDSILEVTARKGKILEYTVSIAVREKDAPEG